jgi:hypothetical protein
VEFARDLPPVEPVAAMALKHLPGDRIRSYDIRDQFLVPGGGRNPENDSIGYARQFAQVLLDDRWMDFFARNVDEIRYPAN